MKAFMLYSENVLCNEIACGQLNIKCSGITCEDCQEIRKDAWKAAMEQVLLWGSDDDVLFNKIKDEIYME